MRLLTRLSIVIFACGLTACVGNNQPKPQLVVEPENVTMRLAAAADRASSALDSLAAIEQTRTPTDLPPLAPSAPPELRRSITVNWIGPVEPIAKQLADRASYQFNITGNKPETPVIVSMNVRNQPVIESLRDIGLQLGGRADLKVDPNLKVIELSYANIQTGDDLADKHNDHPDFHHHDFHDDSSAITPDTSDDQSNNLSDPKDKKISVAKSMAGDDLANKDAQ
jgi:defect-in-organelle-trafficking protein DotD